MKLKCATLTTLRADFKKITQFPVSGEVIDCIDDSKEVLRSLKGFWKGKAMSLAAT